MKKTNYIYSNKGFTTADLVVGIIIIILFISIITTSFYNYYISIQSKNRKAFATNIIIDVIENVEMMNYDDITIDSINDVINNVTTEGNISSGYTVTATLQKYNETEGNENKQDIIKILNVKVEYTVNNKQENIEIKRLILKNK